MLDIVRHLLFIDLEPKENNKNICEIKYLCNMKITVEAPRKKNYIVQFTRCQCCGHTKTYCPRPYTRVKCGSKHNTTLCKKNANTPAKYALCGGNHPANYKGSDIYKNLQKARSKFNHDETSLNRIKLIYNYNRFPPLNHNQPPVPTPTNQQTPYSRILSRNLQSLNMSEQLSAFLNEFKVAFNQLINQSAQHGIKHAKHFYKKKIAQ
jgi:hypothetical protein